MDNLLNLPFDVDHTDRFLFAGSKFDLFNLFFIPKFKFQNPKI